MRALLVNAILHAVLVTTSDVQTLDSSSSLDGLWRTERASTHCAHKCFDDKTSVLSCMSQCLDTALKDSNAQVKWTDLNTL